MRRVLFFLIAIGFALPAPAAPPSPPLAADSSATATLKLMKDYRSTPNPRLAPKLIRALSDRGAFKDPEASGLYVGFLAGVLGSNPKTAKSIIDQTLPLPFEDQWLIIRAVAYSRLPNWRELMRDLWRRLPDRRKLIEYYLTDRLPTLVDIKLEPRRPSTMAKMWGVFKYETYFGSTKKPEGPRELTFATHPELIDTHWGLYFASGRDAPLVRIITLLPWATERDNVEKLTVGSMAKFTLAANAAYDAKILAAHKRLQPELAKPVQPGLTQVIEAAETVDTGNIKREALAAVDELRKKGPGSKRDMAWWGQLGLTGFSAGCLYAAVIGQAELGIPCVVGGALSQAALRYLAAPD